MRIECTYKIADVKEALIPEAQAAKPRRWSGVVRNVVIMLSLGAMLLSVAITLTTSRASAVAVQYPPRDLVADLLPQLVPAAYVWLVLALAFWTNWRKSRAHVKREGQHRSLVRILIGLVFGLIAGGGIIVLTGHNQTFIWHPSSHEAIFIAAAPWSFTVLLMLLLGAGIRRWNPRHQWVSRASWRRTHVVELDESGARWNDAVSSSTYTWAYFSRARETENLLILVGDGQLQHLLPKRAFADTTEVEACRSLLQNKIADTKFLVLPSGFAVLPKSVIPLPPQTQKLETEGSA
jgi:hypothetical protein